MTLQCFNKCYVVIITPIRLNTLHHFLQIEAHQWMAVFALKSWRGTEQVQACLNVYLTKPLPPLFTFPLPTIQTSVAELEEFLIHVNGH